jgi:uncharacterized protein with FMN-binding domain
MRQKQMRHKHWRIIMIDSGRDHQEAAKQLFGSPRKKLLLGTAFAVIASGMLTGRDAILTSPRAQAAATADSSGQATPAPNFADLAQKITPAVVSIHVPESSPVAGSDDRSASPQSGHSITQACAIRALLTSPAASGLTDGTYSGPTVDAYYGLVQVQAIIQGGRVVDVKVLRYPSDRRTSVSINLHALPLLRDEVIQAQNANVDIISGATLTSEAFIRSLVAAGERLAKRDRTGKPAKAGSNSSASLPSHRHRGAGPVGARS